MSAESHARDHVETFRWWRGAPHLTDEQAELRDLLALRDAVQDRIAALRRDERENTLAAAAAPARSEAVSAAAATDLDRHVAGLRTTSSAAASDEAGAPSTAAAGDADENHHHNEFENEE